MKKFFEENITLAQERDDDRSVLIIYFNFLCKYKLMLCLITVYSVHLDHYCFHVYLFNSFTNIANVIRRSFEVKQAIGASPCAVCFFPL